MAVQSWLREVALPPDLPLIDLSQAAPALPPPEGLRRAMAEAVLERPETHLYGPVTGLPELRQALAARTSEIYDARIDASQVAITSGCNQAFTAAIMSLAAAGDEVILPSPWYFNHKMWLDMSGIGVRVLQTGADLLPDPDRAEALIGPRTRAIVLVSPNNPGGVEYAPDLLDAFAELARRHGVMLVLDETYRDFHAGAGPPHRLFDPPDWGETVISLYSFSKAYRLTGHRVGAVICAPSRLRQIEKVLDSVTICPTRLGQIGALYGLSHLGAWLASERDEVLARRRAMTEGIAAIPGWGIGGSGAYFAWVRPPGCQDSASLARTLLNDAGILSLPGTMFAPRGDPTGAGALRLAFANIDLDGIAEVLRRLEGPGTQAGS